MLGRLRSRRVIRSQRHATWVPAGRRVALHLQIALAVASCGSPTGSVDASTSPWTLAPMLPVPHLEPGVTALGQRLVVLGGFDTSVLAPEGLHITSRVDVLDTETGVWTQLPDAPVAWTHLQLAAIGTTLYLLGGLEGAQFVARGDSFALDTAAAPPTWRPIAPIPTGLERGSAAVVVVPPRIYLLGGASSTASLASNLFYDAAQNQWCPGLACLPSQQLPDLPHPRSHPAGMQRADGALVVAGGLGTLDATSSARDTWILPTAGFHPAGLWQSQMAMPSARGGCAFGVLHGQLVCAGGESETSALTVVEGFDPSTNVWQTYAPMPDPRAGIQGAVIGQRLFVPGGARALAFLPRDSVFVFSILDAAM
jgi:N-acetylneuraminic acid mutarotase